MFEKLSSFGTNIIPNLENAWEECFDPILQKRIEELIHRIQFESIETEFIEWAESDATDILKGALIISRYQYPDLNENEIIEKIERIKTDIWIELNDDLTALEKIKIFNHIFYNVHRFSGNSVNHLDPQNSFLNIVFDNKKGNSISLGILYLAIAEMLELPIYGVNLPFHFILTFIDHNEQTLSLFDEDIKARVLFYINPFNKGAIFTEKEIIAYMKKVNPKLTDDDIDSSFFLPCNKKVIISIQLNQLIQSYESLGYIAKVEELQILLDHLNKDS
ncbi:MAG TPA: hypothetical protein EYQ86_07785 [Bacteroidetes bacterium]|nr:hypothetical protein [Bacteroidota bacterium]